MALDFCFGLAFILDFRKEFHVQNNTVTRQILRDIILKQYVHLFKGVISAYFRFMDENDLPHYAMVVEECLKNTISPSWNGLLTPDLNMHRKCSFDGLKHVIHPLYPFLGSA